MPADGMLDNLSLDQSTAFNLVAGRGFVFWRGPWPAPDHQFIFP
jgi:hypothetical protein